MNVYIGKYVGTKDEFFIYCLPKEYSLKEFGFIMIDSIGEPVFKNGRLLLHKVKEPFIVDFTAILDDGYDDVEWVDFHQSKTGFIHTLEDDILPVEKFKEMVSRCDEIEEQHGPCIICGKIYAPYKRSKGSVYIRNSTNRNIKSGWICSEKCLKDYEKNPPEDDSEDVFESIGNSLGYLQRESGMAIVPLEHVPKEDGPEKTKLSKKRKGRQNK